MKKAAALALIAVFVFTCFLPACQPTPDHDIIVNKAEATIPVVKTPKPEGTPAPDTAGTDDASVGNTEQASATASPVDLPEGDPKASRADIPEHVKLEADPQEGVHVKIDADVKFDREGEFPVIEVKQKSTFSDPSFRKKLISSIYSSNVDLYELWQRTKDEVAEELAAAVSYKNDLSVIYVDDSYIESLKNDFITAPEEPEKISVGIDDIQSRQEYYIDASDDRIGIFYFEDENSGKLMRDRYSAFFTAKDFTDDFGRPVDPPAIKAKLTKKEAIDKADAFLKALDLDGYQVDFAEEAYEINTNKIIVSSCQWVVVYCRKIGSGYSLKKWNSETSEAYRNERTVLGNPWHLAERIYIEVDENGVNGFRWETLAEPTQVITEDVPFLNFDELLQRIVDQFGYEYARKDRSFKIKSIDLVYGLLSEKNVPERGLYIPLWQLTYTDNAFGDRKMRLFFSAIDGSVVEPRRQTNRGGY